jgi:nucleoside-diphosphate-sugar epimerase
MVGSSSRIKHQDKRLFMSQLPLPDISRAVNELGWMPIMTLEKGLEKTIEDLKANKGVRRVGEVEY